MTATMTARWSFAAAVTDSPDAPDPRSSIISPPGLGTDHSALTGKAKVILCQMPLLPHMSESHFSSPVHQCAFFIIRRCQGRRLAARIESASRIFSHPPPTRTIKLWKGLRHPGKKKEIIKPDKKHLLTLLKTYRLYMLWRFAEWVIKNKTVIITCIEPVALICCVFDFLMGKNWNKLIHLKMVLLKNSSSKNEFYYFLTNGNSSRVCNAVVSPSWSAHYLFVDRRRCSESRPVEAHLSCEK